MFTVLVEYAKKHGYFPSIKVPSNIEASPSNVEKIKVTDQQNSNQISSFRNEDTDVANVKDRERMKFLNVQQDHALLCNFMIEHQYH